MKSWLAVSFGEVDDWERRHLSEGVSGHLVAGKRGIRGKRRPGTQAKVLLGVPGPAEFWAWPLGWAGWLGELSPSPWYPQYPPFSCRGGRSSLVGKKVTSLTVIL